MPSAPDKAYRDNGWVSWADWLGRETVTHAPAGSAHRIARSALMPFADARAYVHSLRFKAQKDWQAWSKSGARPGNLPGNPNKSYKECGWTTWADWLGAPIDRAYRGHKAFLGFEPARALVRRLELTSSAEWWAWSKAGRPVDVPGNPLRTYRDAGWVSWADWLGRQGHANSPRAAAEAATSPALPFEAARAAAHQLELPSRQAWVQWRKSGGAAARALPLHPARAYRDRGWVSWHDWLGQSASGWAAPAKANDAPPSSSKFAQPKRKRAAGGTADGDAGGDGAAGSEVPGAGAAADGDASGPARKRSTICAV